MGRFLNPGNEAFQKAVRSRIYVDKTGLLEYTNSVCNTMQCFICNSRPRRFGKSYTADMLSAYYSKGCDSRNLFEGFAISREKDFQTFLNQFDVIHIDVQWFVSTANDINDIVYYISRSVLDELREIYKGVNLSGVTSLPEGLSRVYAATGNRFVVIIDEWDVLIREEAANTKIQENYIQFLRGMFKGSEPAKFIELAWMTGILPIKRLTTQSALNNFTQYTMISSGPISSYVGFTGQEVVELCQQYQQDYHKVQQWYDGYRLGAYHIYNPNAVVSLMLEGVFQSYWSATGTYESIVPVINRNFDGLKNAIMEMISGNPVSVDVESFQNDMVNFSSKDDVLTLMIHLGYLAYDQSLHAAYIPNEEIRIELTRAVRSSRWSDFDAYLSDSEELLDATLAMDSTTVAKDIGKIHQEYASQIKYHDENSLGSVLTIAYLSTLRYYFRPIREMPAGRGFADFVYIPKPEYTGTYPAMVIELKWNKSTVTALQQMKGKRYPASVEEYTGNILLVAINYNRTTKEHQCIIEKMQKD